MGAADWDALENAIAGSVVRPGAPAYEQVRKPVIARFSAIRPEAVVVCERSVEVSAVLAFARRAGLQVAIRSGGHCFAGRSSTEGILIDVTGMRSVSVDNAMATVGGGTRLGELYAALDAHGLTIPAGCTSSVGIAGLTLGGGFGILGRKHGLTCDQLLGAEVVLADGRVVECNAHDHEDLFWALRGAGGGNFGVVTSFDFRTVPAPAATGFHLVWPLVAAAALIEAWQMWAPSAPDELDATLRLTVSGDRDQPPAASVIGAMLGSEAETVTLLGGLVAKAGSDPASASRWHGPYRDTKRNLVGLGSIEADGHAPSGGTAPGDIYGKSEFFRRTLPNRAITELVEEFARGSSSGYSRQLDFTPWGGAYNRMSADATAFAHREELFMVEHILEIDPDAPSTIAAAAHDWLARSWALVHPWGSGGVYPNFPDPNLQDSGQAYYGENYERLLDIKARYDPDNVFNFHQSLTPGGDRRIAS